MVDRPQLEHRALEPVAQCLIRHLLVPDVYLDVQVDPDRRLDLVLIDRAGSGDVHLVEVRATPANALDIAASLLVAPGQYRWLAVHATEPEISTLRREMHAFLPAKGAGRVGLVRIVTMANNDIGANIVWKAERFHSGSRAPFVQSLQTRQPDIHFA
jgi:hypothetical protein